MFGKDKYISENPQKTYRQEPPIMEDNSPISTYGPVSNTTPASSTGLLAGKFKSVEDLSRAYIELERKFGLQAQEVGELRRLAEEYSVHKQKCSRTQQALTEFQNFIQNMPEKYHSDNYLNNREFREILKAAYDGYKGNLNVDAMVNMIENYMNARSSMAKKASAISDEAALATDMLAYSNGQSKFKGPKKRLTDMTPEELDKALDELM